MADLSVMGFLNEETQQETEYNIKDAQARNDIGAINGKIPSNASSSNKMATASDITAINNKIPSAASSSNKLVDTTAMNDAIGQAVSAAYKPAGNKTVAELTSSLLVAANRGKVYNMTDAGTTTADFVEGAGHPIRVGDDIGICEPTTGTFKFNILSGFIAVDTNPTQGSANPVSSGGVYSEFAGIKNGQSIDSFGDVETALAGKQDELTFDHTPKNDSLNPVYSDGLYDSFVGAYRTIKNAVGGSGRQLLRNDNQATKTVNDVVITKLSENPKVNLNGTASAGIAYAFMKVTGAELKKYGEKLWLSGGIDNNTFLALITEDWQFSVEDKGNGVEINPSTLTDGTTYVFVLEVANGTALSNVVVSPMLTLASVIDKSFEQYYTKPVSWADAGKSVKKNLLKNEAIRAIQNGVTFTINIDGSVNVDTGGSASTALASRILKEDISDLIDMGDLILSGCPSGGSESKYEIAIQDSAGNSIALSNSDLAKRARDFGNGVTFNLANCVSSSGTALNLSTCRVVLIVRSGQTLSNLMFYPMIRLASIGDGTYVPYIPDNTELIPWEANAKLGVHNLNGTDYSADASASDSIFTVNSYGSVTVNGTVPSGGNVTIGLASQSGFVAPFDAQVKLTGGYNADFHIFAYDMTASARPYKDASKTVRWDSSEAGANQYGDTSQSFYMEKGHKYGMVIRGMAGATVSNVTLYPLLTLFTDTDPTYAPYAMTNKELTENIAFPSASTMTTGTLVKSGDTARTRDVVGGYKKIKNTVFVDIEATANMTMAFSKTFPELDNWGIMSNMPTPVHRTALTAYFVHENTIYAGFAEIRKTDNTIHLLAPTLTLVDGDTIYVRGTYEA